MAKANVVYIAEHAFISILISAIESFPSKFEGSRKPKNASSEGEVYGLLFGQKTRKGEALVYNVSLAVPSQVLMEKTDKGVAPSSRHFEKVKAIIEAFPMFQFLGTFHSHPSARDHFDGKHAADFSSIDALSALDYARIFDDDVLEIILGLTHLTRTINKDPGRSMHYIQNYCGNYKYTLAGYVTDRAEDVLLVLDNLICPFASGIGNYDFHS